MPNPTTIAIIGAGNMGSSLAGGLIKDGHPADKLWVCDPDQDKLNHLASAYSLHATTDNAVAVEHAETIIFAVKPQSFATVAVPLQKTVQLRKPLVISIAAGIREANIQHWLGGALAIVRVMPNTPALIGCGATALFANKSVNAQQHEMAETIMRAVGLIVWVNDETQMDTVTALSGSGPAYFFLMMEALEKAAIELGLSEDTSHLLTIQTALGAAKMALESGKSLAQLRQNVTSPGGTTEKAISVLENMNIRSIYKQALAAAKSRSEELAELVDR